MSNKFQNQEGYVALISILIISGITLLIAINTSFFGISESDMGIKKNQSARAFYLASLCAEDALMKLKDNLSYSGNEILIIERESCDILPLEGSGNEDRVVKTRSTVSGQTRKMKIEINQVNPKMEIGSWQEVTSF